MGLLVNRQFHILAVVSLLTQAEFYTNTNLRIRGSNLTEGLIPGTVVGVGGIEVHR